jgi:nitrate reductase NapE component
VYRYGDRLLIAIAIVIGGGAMFLWLMWQLIYGPPSDDIDQRR